MHTYPDTTIERSGGRIAVMEVSYAQLVKILGEPNAPAEDLDPDKESAMWLLATSEGPAWVYNWLPETGYQAAQTTRWWHIGGARSEVVSCVAQALGVCAHIHWWDPQHKQILTTTVSFVRPG